MSDDPLSLWAPQRPQGLGYPLGAGHGFPTARQASFQTLRCFLRVVGKLGFSEEMLQPRVTSRGEDGLNTLDGPSSLVFSRPYLNDDTIPLFTCGETGGRNNLIGPQSAEEARNASKQWDEPNEIADSLAENVP